ncbi:MAG: DUF3291 domain-containing protein [Methyloligellaceae bacterium]
MKHLAEFNVARFKYQKDDERLSGFMNNLDRVNAIAERSEGFVWRMQDESGDATYIENDENVIVNLSVWESGESLEKFVWQTVHKKMYNRKDEWFEHSIEPNLVMWWVEPGTEPTLAEAVERLEHLRKNGPMDYAFGWAELPGVELFKSKQCA